MSVGAWVSGFVCLTLLCCGCEQKTPVPKSPQDSTQPLAGSVVAAETAAQAAPTTRPDLRAAQPSLASPTIATEIAENHRAKGRAAGGIHAHRKFAAGGGSRRKAYACRSISAASCRKSGYRHASYKTGFTRGAQARSARSLGRAWTSRHRAHRHARAATLRWSRRSNRPAHRSGRRAFYRRRGEPAFLLPFPL